MVYSADRSTQKDTSSSAVTSSLSDLIARLEKATGPDRELDRDIWRIACGKASFRDYAPLYTESIDAAMTLVPQHFEFEIGSTKLLNCYYAMLVDRHGEHIGKRCANPAIALCIAALKARSLPAI